MNYPTIDKPTTPGWYWYRPGQKWIMMEVFERFDGSLWVQPPVPLTARSLDSMTVLHGWRGPIPEPTP
jgi:hypothetical protein